LGEVDWPDEKNYVQLMGRHGSAYVRLLMAKLRAVELNVGQVVADLGVSERRVRQLYRTYLEACGRHREVEWEAGKSGGNRTRAIPEAVAEMWRKMLQAKPPAPYAFIASESLRWHHFHVDRATVRRWAFQTGTAHGGPPKKNRPPGYRRWQCSAVGMLWQLDASPHRWLGESQPPCSLLDMVDDCSRVIVGARLYPHECLMAYMDFLPRAFEEYGLPTALYVDFHSFFFTKIPDNLTYLGRRFATTA
jgi:hypothetical protein